MGHLLVGLQFGLIAWLVVTTGHGAISGTVMLLSPRNLPALVLIALALLVGVLAVWVNRPGNFRILPTPKAGATLITHGIYRTIRHPMYTSVLLLCAGGAWVAPNPWVWLIWLALLAVLLAKAELEERSLCQAFAAYSDYQQRTQRVLPGIF